MSQAITIARPYAQAAFEEALASNSLSSWSEILIGLAELVNNDDVQKIIFNPKASKEQASRLFEACIPSTTAKQQNFVRILVDNQRLQVLPEIAAMFEALKAEAEKSVDVIVDSAFELNSGQQEKIVNSLKKRTGREVRLTCKVNKDLLGGVVIRVGDKVIDGSARTRLAEMATALA